MNKVLFKPSLSSISFNLKNSKQWFSADPDQTTPVGATWSGHTVKILKFGTPQTIAITVLKIEKFDVTLH